MEEVAAPNPPASLVPRRTLIHAVAFVLGFSLIFVLGWGGAAPALGSLFRAYKGAPGRIGGGVVIVFGLVTAAVSRIPWLMRDTRFLTTRRSHSLWNSGIFGVLFAAGWSPCIGT